MHKKRAHVPFMHSLEARPKALHEYMKRQCAQLGASSLACRSCMKCLVVFRRNDLLALMLNFQTPGGDAARAEHPPYRCGRRWNAVPTGVVRRTANHPSRFPDYVTAPRYAPHEMVDIISKIWAGGELFSRLVWGHAALPYGGVSGRDERQSRLGAYRKCKARSRTAPPAGRIAFRKV